jgi:hypothetical protein
MSPVFGFNTDIRYGDTVYHVQTEAHEAEHTVKTAIFVRGQCIDKRESSYASDESASENSEASVHRVLTRQHKYIVNCIREGNLALLLGTCGERITLPAQDIGDQAPKEAAELLDPWAGPSASSFPEEPSSEMKTADDADILGLVFNQTWAHPTPAPGIVPEPQPEPEPLEEIVDFPELKLDWLSSDSVFTGNSVKLRYRLTLGSRGVEGGKVVVRLEVGGIPSAYARTVTDCQGEAEVTVTLAPAAMNCDQLSITVQASYSGQSTARRFHLANSRP